MSTQTSFTTSIGEFLLCEVPEGAINISVSTDNNLWCETDKSVNEIQLPPGSWTIAVEGTKGITEDHVADICDMLGERKHDTHIYWDYMKKQFDFIDWKQSFNSLLISLKADKDKDYIILKQNK